MELVVLVAILAALVAILVPICSGIRQSARDVVCAARLRDLTFACASYLHDNDSYPPPVQDTRPLPAVSPASSPFSATASGLQPMPQNSQTRLFNDLACYLRFPKIVGGAAAVDLPPSLQCPSLEAVEDGRGPLATLDPGNSSYFTGYDYLAGLDGATIQGSGAAPAASTLLNPLPTGSLPVPIPSILNLIPGTVLKPGRAAPMRGGGRAVLWSDDVRLCLQSGSTPNSAAVGAAHPGGSFWPFWHAGQPQGALPPGAYWVFAHAQGGMATGPVPLSAVQAAACRGQHRAFTDNSVEWQKADNIGLPATVPATGPGGAANLLLDPAASFQVNSTYWWY